MLFGALPTVDCLAATVLQALLAKMSYEARMAVKAARAGKAVEFPARKISDKMNRIYRMVVKISPPHSNHFVHSVKNPSPSVYSARYLLSGISAHFFLVAGIAQAGHFNTMPRKCSIASRTPCFEAPVNEPVRLRISAR